MNTLKQNYSRGNDFEFHLFDRTKKAIVSAIPVLKCDKHSPIDLGDGIKLYADNVLVETAFPPYYSQDEMHTRFHTVFTRIQEKLGDNYRLVPQAAHNYDDTELKDPKALEIGCAPNFDAWNVAMNHPEPFQDNLRTAGAHFHVGNEKLMDFETRIAAIKMMDIFVGVPSVIFNPDKTEIQRRKIYGRASEHRPTTFGLEYRALSPGVLRSKKMVDLIYDLINHSLSHIEQNTFQDVLDAIDPEAVKAAINNCDKKLAKQIMKQSEMPNALIKKIAAKDAGNFYKSWKI